MRTLRCSALPRIMRCPASQVPPEIVIESDNIAGRIGQAVHELMAQYIQGVEFAIHDVSVKHRVDWEQVAPLFYIGKRIFDENIRENINLLGVERAMQWKEGGITGTADIVGRDIFEELPTLIIVDIKTGSPTTDHRDQLISYGKLALEEYPEFERVKIITLWLRDQFYDIEDISPEDIADWEKRLTYAREHPEEYCPGEACIWCPQEHECKARKQLVQTAATDFVGASEDATVPAKLASLYPQAKLLKKALDRYDDALKATIKASGPISLDDGRQLGLIDVTRQNIGLTAAWPVIEAELGSLEAAYPAMTISKTKLTKLVSAQAERGQKGKAIKAFMDALQEAGAIQESSYQKLSIVKAPALEEGEGDE